MNYELLLLKVSSILGAEKIKSNIDKYTREEHPTSSINKKRRATSILYRTDVKLEFAGRLCATNVGHANRANVNYIGNGHFDLAMSDIFCIFAD